jgi:hypothetical protein
VSPSVTWTLAAVIGFVNGAFWIARALLLNRPRVQRVLRSQEARPSHAGFVFYLWLSRTRLRALAFALTNIAFGLWFLILAKGA